MLYLWPALYISFAIAPGGVRPALSSASTFAQELASYGTSKSLLETLPLFFFFFFQAGRTPCLFFPGNWIPLLFGASLGVG